MDEHEAWCEKKHSWGTACDPYSYIPVTPSNYDKKVWDILDHGRVVTQEEMNLGQVLAKLFSGYWVYPASNNPNEGIPYKLNALYDARKILDELKRQE